MADIPRTSKTSQISERLKDVAASDSGFIFDPFTGLTFTVNPTAHHILDALKAGDDRHAIMEGLREAFDTIDSDDLERDLREFMLLLREQGLIPRDAEV